MNCYICRGNFWRVEIFGGRTLLCMILVYLLFCGCVTYGIFSVPWLAWCTRNLLHVVPMMIFHLVYSELLLLSLVGLAVCGCSQILQICACRMIGGDTFLIVWAYIDWWFRAIVICSTTGGGNIYLRFIVLLWSYFLNPGWFSLNCFPCYFLWEPAGTWLPWLPFSF